jgi:hypothetical protein
MYRGLLPRGTGLNQSISQLLNERYPIQQLEWTEISYRFLIIMLLTTFLVFIYKTYFKAQNKRTENELIVFLAGPIVCMILLGIGASLPRAFGLFAALSIIRLRTPIKDTSEMVFIFISVGLGICLGAGAQETAFTGMIIFTLGIYLFQLYEEQIKKSKFCYAITIQYKDKFPMEQLEQYGIENIYEKFEDHIHTINLIFEGKLEDFNTFKENMHQNQNIINFESEKLEKNFR